MTTPTCTTPGRWTWLRRQPSPGSGKLHFRRLLTAAYGVSPAHLPRRRVERAPERLRADLS